MCWEKVIDRIGENIEETQVAGGRRAMLAMRGVSHSWQSGFERSVKSLRIGAAGPVPPPGNLLAERFPGLTSLNLGNSTTETAWLENLRAFPNLRTLVLGDFLPGGSFTYRLADADLRHLEGMRISNLSLCNCEDLTDAGLESLRGLPLTRLDLEGCTELSASGLGCLRGKPLTWLNLKSFNSLASRAAIEQLEGLPLTFLDLSCDISEGDVLITFCEPSIILRPRIKS